MYRMPKEWEGIFGTEVRYSKPISALLTKVVNGEHVTLPITVEPLR